MKADLIDCRFWLAKLAELQPDVIELIGAVEVRALKKAAAGIPIVFAVVPDPTAAGLVDSNTIPAVI